jgi:hypothetical protein
MVSGLEEWGIYMDDSSAESSYTAFREGNFE